MSPDVVSEVNKLHSEEMEVLVRIGQYLILKDWED